MYYIYIIQLYFILRLYIIRVDSNLKIIKTIDYSHLSINGFRLLWLVLVLLSWYGSALLIIAAWDAFVTSPISFGVETNYLNWETKMPAVAVCETSNDDKVYAVSDE